MVLEEESGSEDNDDLFLDAVDDFIPTEQVVTMEPSGLREKRLTLPNLRPPDLKVSVWSILKEGIGKDLTKITMPIIFNEPLSLLQKSCETMEYNQLLVDAVTEQNSLVRLAYVAAHNISQFSSYEGRKTKPFNPLLGETFDYMTPEYKFFSEQVSHHPPVSAYHCTANDGSYEIFSAS